MSIRKFLIQICGVFLSMSLSKTIEKIITQFSWFVLIAGVLIFFLSLNFFFAKFKQLQESNETITLVGFVANILTLSCFAAMPFLIDNFLGLMCIQLVLRIFDTCLIFHNNKWRFKNIDKIEMRWLLFDITYFFAIVCFIILYKFVKYEYLSLMLISIYLIMGIFESLFDFIVNKYVYGMTIKQVEPVAVVTESEMVAAVVNDESTVSVEQTNITQVEENNR